MSKYAGAKPDEIFVGNTDAAKGIPEYLRELKTVRLGDQALDINGNKLSPAEYLPIFIGRSEQDAYNRIMMRKTFPNQKIW
jgi:hypothetical protein